MNKNQVKTNFKKTRYNPDLYFKIVNLKMKMKEILDNSKGQLRIIGQKTLRKKL